MNAMLCYELVGCAPVYTLGCRGSRFLLQSSNIFILYLWGYTKEYTPSKWAYCLFDSHLFSQCVDVLKFCDVSITSRILPVCPLAAFASLLLRWNIVNNVRNLC